MTYYPRKTESPYQPGTVHGCWKVIRRHVFDPQIRSREVHFECECITCGVVQVRTALSLRKSKKHDSSHCAKCRGIHSTRVYSKYCSQCEGMAWRRPGDGSPCRCGERYGIDVIPTPSLQQSSASICADNCAVSYRSQIRVAI